MPWLLSQMKLTNNATGKHLLDVFTLHYYPQRGEYGELTPPPSCSRSATKHARSLGSQLCLPELDRRVGELIPRMKDWVNTYYPGTKIGITEYNWGAEGHINGATRRLISFGIFGRENLDLAARSGRHRPAPRRTRR